MSLRQWSGQRSDLPIIGDHLLTAKNITFRVGGQVSRRPGLTFLNGNGAQSMISYGNAGKTWLIQVDSDGTVEAAAL